TGQAELLPAQQRPCPDGYVPPPRNVGPEARVAVDVVRDEDGQVVDEPVRGGRAEQLTLDAGDALAAGAERRGVEADSRARRSYRRPRGSSLALPAMPMRLRSLVARLAYRAALERDYWGFRLRHGRTLRGAPPADGPVALIVSLTHLLYQVKLEGMLA